MIRNLFSSKLKKFTFSNQHVLAAKLEKSTNKNQNAKYFSASTINCSGSAVDLSHTLFEPQSQLSSSVPVVILHGLLGSKQNWRGLAKAIATNSKRKVYTLDARNHGDSPHADDYSYPLMSEDVKHFMSSHDISEAVIVGHSMGGRTAMYLALTNETLINKLIIVDVSPVTMPKQSQLIPGYMKAMKEAIASIPKSSLVKARKSIDDILSKSIPEEGIRQFLLTNLVEENNILKWKANLDVLFEKFESGLMAFPLVSGYYSKEVVFIHGGDSPFIRPDDHPDIKKLFPKAEFITIAGAGHWVHSEKPSEFLSVMYDIL